MTEYGRTQAKAIPEAERLGHKYIGTEHFFLGILAQEEGPAAKMLGSHGVTLQAARSWVNEHAGDGGPDAVRWTYSPRATVVCALAEVEADRLGHPQPADEHFILAMITEGSSLPVNFFLESGVEIAQLRADIVDQLDDVPEDVRERYIRQREAYERVQREEGGLHGWWHLQPSS